MNLASGHAWVVAVLTAASAQARAAEPSSEGFSCDTSVEEFRDTGTIRCGHFLWDLQPEHARKMQDPLSYFQKYERYYGFMKDLTGLEPKTVPIPVRERCSPERIAGFDCERPFAFGELPAAGPGCPKGYNRFCYPAYRSEDPAHGKADTLFINEANVGSDVVFTANHSSLPLFASFTHEIGHMFQPFDERDRGYRWDNVGTESWADNLALVGYGVFNEVNGTGESWYWDGFCDRRARHHPCDTFMRSVDDYASMDADDSLAAYEAKYETRGNGLLGIVHIPVERGLDGHTEGRDHILTGMLIDLYRDFKKRGRGDDFFQGFRKLVRFYHQRFPSLAPAGWLVDDEQQTARLVEAKANVLVFLLSAFTKSDLAERFADWRWKVHAPTRSAIRSVAGEDGADEAVERELTRLLAYESSAVKSAVR